MSLIVIIVLALIQGLTEFLPISSSAHLILPSQVLGWEDQGHAFDVAVHVGSLLAVVLYFRKDVSDILTAWFKSFGRQGSTNDSRLGWYIIMATFPAIIFGLLASDFIATYARSPVVIASSTIIFGLLLWWADIKAKQTITVDMVTWKKALIIGFAQAVAIIPGTSRSGITMTAGLMLGLTRDAAARFSFLLSIPVILAAGSYLTLKLVTTEDAVVDWLSMSIGAGLAFVSAYACIHLFLKVINSMGMLPFVIYRLALGVGLFLFIYL